MTPAGVHAPGYRRSTRHRFGGLSMQQVRESAEGALGQPLETSTRLPHQRDGELVAVLRRPPRTGPGGPGPEREEMARRRHAPGQIISKLREAQVSLAQGQRAAHDLRSGHHYWKGGSVLGLTRGKESEISHTHFGAIRCLFRGIWFSRERLILLC